MQNRNWRSAAGCALGAALLLNGCTTLGPDYQPPEPEVEQRWLDTDAPGVQPREVDYGAWWSVFDDPVLNALIEEAYQQNLPLQIAGLRILEARAQLGIAIGDQYPQLQQAAGALNRNRISENSPNFNPIAEDSFWQANIGFDAAWELDFWGRFRRGVESAAASLGSQVASFDSALVSLTAEVARVYVTIRTLQEQLEVARANAATQQRGYEIANVRYEAGAVSELDRAQALTLLRDTEAAIPVLQGRIRQSMNALSILLGAPPRDLSVRLGEGGIPETPAEVAVGMPADLLRRRPDIRQAELQAAAQSALIGVARSELYPRLSLVGSIGFVSSDTNQSDLGDLFKGDSLAYSVGPSFVWPIFNYGRLQNNVRVQDARLEQLLVNYQNQVLDAAREVEDGLAGFLAARAATDYLGDSVDAAQRAVDLSLIQYREGAVDYQRVLDSQQRLLGAEEAWTNARGDIILSLVQTYKALGGGWQIRTGQDFVRESLQERMRERTDWGDLVPGETLPAGLPEPPPSGGAQPLLNAPLW
ncbi:MAG: efflux transporter outer membrane subunit [Gammaproteobacteria bacterium]